jgi:hypothetical protein
MVKQHRQQQQPEHSQQGRMMQQLGLDAVAAPFVARAAAAAAVYASLNHRSAGSPVYVVVLTNACMKSVSPSTTSFRWILVGKA